ncbi:unnamed protein product [Chondrus crispus]|uniref:NADH-ubiquinone oxidoreductase 12 kDa subunit n=1 Tax=Chondrus crispus TaxID=2769 RepID=R7Q747_CHOCR|nr:unnamed protein product [Chondrus crispus]CDF33206.1 unnamed protein product [Chondrus crispus]|eukprot:XP_005713009.1 unnamed protein product [Chondrus crispus]
MPERKVKREFKPVPDVRPDDPGADPFQIALAREQRAREAMVAIEETRILGERLAHCYQTEGVNHLVKCEALARAYYRRITRSGLKGPVELSDIE